VRIKKLELLKYGKFSGQPLELPASATDFHVIVGPNEAGKSTVRSAVVELLFGMPQRTPLSFLHDVSELRLGGVVEHNGTETVFHRARGRAQLRTPSDEKLSDDLLAEALDGISKEFFEQMYSLDHGRLIEGGRSILNASDRLGQVLFESAAGVGSLSPMREQLEELTGTLWTSRGNKSEYAQAEARLNQATSELRGAQVRTKVWVEARDALQTVDDEIAIVRTEQLRLETLQSKLERVRRLAPHLQELTTRQAELDALGDVVELAASAYDELAQARADIAAAKKVAEERASDFNVQEIARAALTTDDKVLRFASDIEELDRMRGAYVNHPRDLPLRKADRNRLLMAASDAASQLGWPTDQEGLQAALPKSLALKTVTNLLRSHGALEQAVVGATEALDEKKRDLERLTTQLTELTQTDVPAGLRQSLSEAQGLKDSRMKESSLSRSVAAAERHLDEALASLGLWKKPIDELRTLTMPSASRLTSIQRDETEREGAVSNAEDALAQAQAVADDLELQERQFAGGTKVVTTAEVMAERSRRDQAWDGIKAGIVSLEQGAPTVDSAIRLADELVDAQLGTTQVAANLQSLRNQLEAAQADVKRKRSSLDNRKRELESARASWQQIAASTGVPEMPLGDVADWVIKRQEALEVNDALELHRCALADVRQASSDAAAHLLDALSTASIAPPSEDLQTLIRAAESLVSEAERRLATKEGLEKQQLLAKSAMTAAQVKLDRANAAYTDWRAQWDDALRESNLAAGTTTLAEAEGAVELATNIAQHLAKAEELRVNRIETMEEDLQALGNSARRIAGEVSPELLALNDWPEVARQLMQRLTTARDDARAVERADELLRAAKSKRTDANTSVTASEARIRPILLSAGVDSIDDALPIAERSDKRRSLMDAVEKARSVLIRDGDGLSQEALAAEIGEFNPAEVPGLHEEVKRELSVANERRSQAMQTQVTAKQAFEAINGRANAAVAEAMRQEAIATMGEVAEQYLEAVTAARLLKWATDRYRDQKQGPMLKRAGEIFAGLTLGQFSKLGVDSEANPPALYAKRNTGATVEVSGLSEGTRDQLFLSLRIAALELQLKHKKPLPFIADDLFINFDDARAKAGLEALRDLSRLTQVVFLTHHDHLLSLVAEVFGADANIVRLERAAVLP
jgi:uncharacterized protein YhaN